MMENVSLDPLFPQTSVVGLKLRQAGDKNAAAADMPWCLDTAGRTVPGMQLSLGTCDSLSTTFAWNPISGRIRGAGGLCLVAPGGGTSKGGELVMAKCSAKGGTLAADASFAFVPVARGDAAGNFVGELRAAETEWCADSLESGGRLGDSVVMWACGGASNQWRAEISVAAGTSATPAGAVVDAAMPTSSAAPGSSSSSSSSSSSDPLWSTEGPCATGPKYWCASRANMKACGVAATDCPNLAHAANDDVRAPPAFRAGGSLELQHEVGAMQASEQQEGEEVAQGKKAAEDTAAAARMLAFREMRGQRASVLQHITAVDAADSNNNSKTDLQKAASAILKQEVVDGDKFAMDAANETAAVKSAEKANANMTALPKSGTASGTLKENGNELPASATTDPNPGPATTTPMPSVATIEKKSNMSAECEQEAKMRKKDAEGLLAQAKQVVLFKKDVDAAQAALKNVSGAYQGIKKRILDHLSQAHTLSVDSWNAHESKGPGVESRLNDLQAEAQLALKEQKAMIAMKVELRPLLKAVEEATSKWRAATEKLKKEAETQMEAVQRAVTDLTKKIKESQGALESHLNTSITDASKARDLARKDDTPLEHLGAALTTASLSARSVENLQYFLKELLRRKDMAKAAVKSVMRAQGKQVKDPDKAHTNDLLSDKEMSDVSARRKASDASEASDVGVARRTSGACAERSGAKG